MGAFAAIAMGVTAEAACTITVTKFNQPYPYSGRATVEYTVGGTLPMSAIANITVTSDGASATFTQSGVVAGANRNVIDFASSFGGALLLTNASYVVTITDDLGGVQLWENGPFWAERNVGATKPKEYGYYFWWGGTRDTRTLEADGSRSRTVQTFGSALRTAGQARPTTRTIRRFSRQAR